MDILHINSLLKQWGDVVGSESGDATAYRGDEERLFGMRLGIADKLIHIGLDGLHATLHGGDGIALPLRTVTVADDSTEVESCHACGTASVHPGEVAAEDENLVGLE